jgi:hypothetical protein
MCWSASVSGAFALLDGIFIIVLLVQRRHQRQLSQSNSIAPPSYHALYVAFLAAITLQECAQYVLWKNDSLESQESSCDNLLDVGGSLLASTSAQSVPMILLAASYWEQYDKLETRVYCETLRIRSFLCWSLQCAVIVLCIVLTGQYCVTMGPHHHQVWICASAVYESGGYAFYFFTLACYIASAYMALECLVGLPVREKEWIVGIGVANGIWTYGMYCWTLEACSIWCWSGFTYGIYFCLKDYMM